MTSSNGNIFHVTGPLWGNPTVTGGFPHKGPVTRNFDVFFDLCNGWANNRKADDLGNHRANYDAPVMHWSVVYFEININNNRSTDILFHPMYVTSRLFNVFQNVCSIKCIYILHSAAHHNLNKFNCLLSEVWYQFTGLFHQRLFPFDEYLCFILVFFNML